MSLEVSRAEMEDFLYAEAALLDEWRLDEWFGLFADGATYEVPPIGADGDVHAATALFYIADDYVRLRERVTRLNSPDAHSEYPRSRVRHMVSNVRITAVNQGIADVCANFVTYRAKNRVVDTYYGQHAYKIDCNVRPWKIRAKRSTLDMDLLYPGKLTIIV